MKRLFVRRLFLHFLVAALGIFSSTSVSAREITYQIKDYSSIAHRLIGDDGQNVLYMIPLNDITPNLVDKFDIKRATVHAIDSHILPGKTLLRAARHLLFKSPSDYKLSEPKLLFSALTQGVPHTYVVTKNHLIFIESTKTPESEPCKDRFSKHYVISGMEKNVRFAGEFFVYRDKNGSVYVVFDNASGTYRPDTKALPQLKTVLDNNLADQNIQFLVKSFDQAVDANKMFAGHEDFLIKKDF